MPSDALAILEAFAARDIQFIADRMVDSYDPARKVVTLIDETKLDCDLFICIPKHRVPAVVAESGQLVPSLNLPNPWSRIKPILPRVATRAGSGDRLEANLLTDSKIQRGTTRNRRINVGMRQRIKRNRGIDSRIS